MPKAASQSMRAAMALQFGHDNCFDVDEVPAGFLTLMVGRDSLSRVSAAYAEVDAHGARLGNRMTKGMNTSFQYISRLEEPRRFLTFLQELFRGDFGAGAQAWPESWLPQHAHPVSCLTQDKLHTFDAILRFSHLEFDWRLLLSSLGISQLFQVLFV
jgi:hypothetical protein